MAQLNCGSDLPPALVPGANGACKVRFDRCRQPRMPINGWRAGEVWDVIFRPGRVEPVPGTGVIGADSRSNCMGIVA
jgi:hypothetical protein